MTARSAGQWLPRQPYLSDELLVVYKTSDALQRGRAVPRVRSTVIQTFAEQRMNRLKLAPGVSLTAAVNALRQDSTVAYVQPNYLYRPTTEPNDPIYGLGYMWDMYNAGQWGGTPGADISATRAWSLTTGSRAVAVAVIDTGVDYTHPDLAANIWTNPREVAGNGRDDDGNGYVDDIHGWNAVDHNGDPMDHMGHGTHVAGTIGAVGNNRVGVAGVCWNVSIVACRFIGPSGFGTTAAAIECIRYIDKLKDSGVNIVAINASWGSDGFDQALKDAIDEAGRRGILFVCAAGNGDDSGNPQDDDRVTECPASFGNANLIAVTATDRYDQKASWANYGARTVALGAPGVDIWSTLPNNQYGSYSGTSMAAPHVTGAVALLAAYNPSLNSTAIKERILSTGDALPSLSGLTSTGRRLNLYAALMTTPPPPALPSIQVAISSGKASYTFLQAAIFTVRATSGGGPLGNAAVRVDIRTPTGRLFTGRGTTNSAGQVSFSMYLPIWNGRGRYDVAASATKQGYTSGAASTSFTVR